MAKQTFRSNSGRDFDTLAEAEQSDRVVEAVSELESARRKFIATVAKTQLTKDGQQFDFSGTYYRVIDCFDARLEEIDFYSWKIELDSRDLLTVMQIGRNGQWEAYRICDLYRSKLEAQKELYAALERRLQQRCEELNELGQRIRTNLPPITTIRKHPEAENI